MTPASFLIEPAPAPTLHPLYPPPFFAHLLSSENVATWDIHTLSAFLPENREKEKFSTSVNIFPTTPYWYIVIANNAKNVVSKIFRRKCLEKSRENWEEKALPKGRVELIKRKSWNSKDKKRFFSPSETQGRHSHWGESVAKALIILFDELQKCDSPHKLFSVQTFH